MTFWDKLLNFLKSGLPPKPQTTGVFSRVSSEKSASNTNPMPQSKEAGASRNVNRTSLPDRRQELGASLKSMNSWSGLTVDLLAARLVSHDAARDAFRVLLEEASRHVTGRGVVVVL